MSNISNAVKALKPKRRFHVDLTKTEEFNRVVVDAIDEAEAKQLTETYIKTGNIQPSNTYVNAIKIIAL
jgi:hypothetical protein